MVARGCSLENPSPIKVNRKWAILQELLSSHMKNFDSRTYSINDFVEWDAAGQLKLNPKFQRRSVWSPKAKSYLIDTILRGKPIAKVFIRQQINVTTKTSLREVVDGQQRLRTILSFVKDGFQVSKSHNPQYGGVLFSGLPEEVQSQILSFEISVDQLINLPDSEVLDIFNRLNSYAVILNEQEKLNAAHFGPFKLLSDRIGQKYNEFWTSQRILTSSQLVRMGEISLVADLIISMLEGIKSKKQIKKYYVLYESSFNYDVSNLEERFDQVIQAIADLYPEGLSETEFRRPVLFYTLFTTVAHRLFGIPGIDNLMGSGGLVVEVSRNRIELVEEIIQASDITILTREMREFRTDSSRATTDEAVRKRRTLFLLQLLA